MSHPVTAPADPDDRRTVREEIAFTGEKLLPWAVSILLHVAVVLLALFIVWSARLTDPEAEHMVTWNPRPPRDADFNFAAALPTLPVDTFEQPDPRPTTHPDAIATPTVREGVNLPVPGPLAKPTPLGVNTSTASGIFDPDDPPSEQAPRSVVFVIDASGSMVEQFSRVQRDLGRAIRRLEPSQRFTVIYFQQDRAMEAPPQGLRLATADHAARFFAWGGEQGEAITPRGASNPLPALQFALAYRPDEIRLLSDNITGSGAYAVDAERLLAEVERLKRLRRAEATRISTIQFLRPDTTRTLERLAAAHGGFHRFVPDARRR